MGIIISLVIIGVVIYLLMDWDDKRNEKTKTKTEEKEWGNKWSSPYTDNHEEIDLFFFLEQQEFHFIKVRDEVTYVKNTILNPVWKEDTNRDKTLNNMMSALATQHMTSTRIETLYSVSHKFIQPEKKLEYKHKYICDPHSIYMDSLQSTQKYGSEPFPVHDYNNTKLLSKWLEGGDVGYCIKDYARYYNKEVQHRITILLNSILGNPDDHNTHITLLQSTCLPYLIDDAIEELNKVPGKTEGLCGILSLQSIEVFKKYIPEFRDHAPSKIILYKGIQWKVHDYGTSGYPILIYRPDAIQVQSHLPDLNIKGYKTTVLKFNGKQEYAININKKHVVKIQFPCMLDGSNNIVERLEK